MVGKTAAERMAAQRKRRKRTGLKRFETWAHPKDCELLRVYARYLANVRAQHHNQEVK